MGGITEIGTLNPGGSRRGSFRAPINDNESARNRGSESKERMGGGIGFGGGGGPGLPRPNTGNYDH